MRPQKFVNVNVDVDVDVNVDEFESDLTTEPQRTRR